jgi:hypothetical protein
MTIWPEYNASDSERLASRGFNLIDSGGGVYVWSRADADESSVWISLDINSVDPDWIIARVGSYDCRSICVDATLTLAECLALADVLPCLADGDEYISLADARALLRVA